VFWCFGVLEGVALGIVKEVEERGREVEVLRVES